METAEHTVEGYNPDDGSGTPLTEEHRAIWNEAWPETDFGLVCECGADTSELATLKEWVDAGWEQHGWLDYPAWMCAACCAKERTERAEIIACTFVHNLDVEDPTGTERVYQARAHGLTVLFEEERAAGSYAITVRGTRGNMGKFARESYAHTVSNDAVESFAPADPEHLKRAR